MILRNRRSGGRLSRTGSAAQPLGQVLEVSRDDVPLARRRDVLVRVRAMLVRSRHEGRSEAECLRVTEVAIVGGDHHALGGCEPEERGRGQIGLGLRLVVDRKSTRLNSSHLVISYAVFCLKKKKKK